MCVTVAQRKNGNCEDTVESALLQIPTWQVLARKWQNHWKSRSSASDIFPPSPPCDQTTGCSKDTWVGKETWQNGGNEGWGWPSWTAHMEIFALAKLFLCPNRKRQVFMRNTFLWVGRNIFSRFRGQNRGERPLPKRLIGSNFKCVLETYKRLKLKKLFSRLCNSCNVIIFEIKGWWQSYKIFLHHPEF